VDERSPGARMMNRRRFLRLGAGALATGATLGAYSRWVEPHWLEVTHRRLAVPALPTDLAGRSLVQISDLHTGPRVDETYLVSVLELVKGLRPDIVAFTGDAITYRAPRHLDQLARVLEHLPHGAMATVGTLGNHDYGPGWSHAEIASAVETRARNAGMTVLRNDVTRVGGLALAGFDDLWAKRFEARGTIARLAPGEPAIALCHNPDAVDLPGWEGFHGPILAGHTHGGQVRPPFLPPLVVPVRNKRYTAGWFDLHDGRGMYISRGIGHLWKIRFCVRPEVTVFTLAPASPAAA
jgi:hypothetical protein